MPASPFCLLRPLHPNGTYLRSNPEVLRPPTPYPLNRSFFTCSAERAEVTLLLRLIERDRGSTRASVRAPSGLERTSYNQE